MATMYTLTACENLIQKFIDNGGEVATLEEGILGLGLTMCYGDGLKIAIIREVYLNEWSSGHTIRMYNKMPKKYEQMLEDYWNRNWDE